MGEEGVCQHGRGLEKMDGGGDREVQDSITRGMEKVIKDENE